MSDTDSTQSTGGNSNGAMKERVRSVRESIVEIKEEQKLQWTDITENGKDIARLQARNKAMQWVGGVVATIFAALLGGLAVKIFGG